MWLTRKAKGISSLSIPLISAGSIFLRFLAKAAIFSSVSWTFSHLCNLYGIRPEWEEAAKLGKDFIEKHIADTDGRMYFTLTKEGLPLRKRRYFFTESFYVLSMAEYSIMANDKDALKKEED